MKKIFILLFLTISFIQCQEKQNINNNVEHALYKLSERFDQLPKAKNSLSTFYKLERTVIIGEKQIQLQLRSTPDSIDDKQQIVIVINPEGKCVGIPLFSNTYRDYWSFEFDTIPHSAKRANTTFSKEFNSSMKDLHLNDTLGTSRTILYEMFISLLHCEVVTEADSLKFEIVSLTGNNDVPKEDSYDCLIRSRKNFKIIKKDAYRNPNIWFYNSYWDKRNNRIYQIGNLYESNLLPPKIKTYRQECTLHFFTL